MDNMHITAYGLYGINRACEGSAPVESAAVNVADAWTAADYGRAIAEVAGIDRSARAWGLYAQAVELSAELPTAEAAAAAVELLQSLQIAEHGSITHAVPVAWGRRVVSTIGGSSWQQSDAEHINALRICDAEEYAGRMWGVLCAAERDGRSCAECGSVDNLRAINGRYYCSNCVITCDHCGSIAPVSDCVETEQGAHYCCRQCARAAGCSTCDNCGSWHDAGNLQDVEGAGELCESCLDAMVDCGDVYECDVCGELYATDYLTYDEHREQYLCDNCRPDYSDCINNYSYKPAPQFWGAQSRHEAPHMGVELEMCYGDDAEHTAYDIVQGCSGHGYCKHDGSLDDEGVEFVTHPADLQAHAGGAFWRDVCEVATGHGMRSHDTSCCGLHVHIDLAYFGRTEQAQDVARLKLFTLVNRMRQALQVFARRESTRWASFAHKSDVTRYNLDGQTMGLFARAQSCRYENNCDRYVAVNLCNRNTVELRIFKGTLKPETLHATLCLCDGLARYAKTHSAAACARATWADLHRFITDTCGTPAALAQFEAYCLSKGL